MLIHETDDQRSEELRESPSPLKGGNLIGRGIANPMSERTHGGFKLHPVHFLL
jgi:hypothetical protein